MSESQLLRFSTAGSVDDGKSTLIGRLLYESRMIYEDQLAALEAVQLERFRAKVAQHRAAVSVEPR